MKAFKMLFAILFLGLFLCAGLAIAGAGIAMFMHLNKIIEVPFKFEGGTYSAIMYTIIGVVWTLGMVFALIKTIKSIRNS